MSKWELFSRTALDAINNSDAFINIYEGAVRSSKTVSSVVAWIYFLAESPHREFLMTGHTLDTLYRNVIGNDMGMISILGERNCQYKKSTEGGATLIVRFNRSEKRIYCVGAPNIKAEAKIRGMTIGGWYADEITTYPIEVVNQALNRMSLKGARAYWTMNPDSPFHIIKTNYIDKAQEKGFRHFHFTLDDNLSLDDDYKENLKKSYSGLWFERMVEGKWVLAEGVVYSMFDREKHVVSEAPQGRTYIGVDYGTSNATAFVKVVLADGCFYVVDEYKHSGGEMAQSKTDNDYAEDLREFIGGDSVRWVFVDPSAKSFRTQLYRERREYEPFRKVYPARNDVIDGIRVVSSLLGSDKLKIHERCTDLLQEISMYSWDPKHQQKGEDKPLEKNDHLLDALRYAIYTSGDYDALLKGVR